MNALVVFAAVIATAVAGRTAKELISVNRGALGNYDIKYATAGMSRSEHRNILGEVNGGYSYVDPNGLLRKISYYAGEDGFHAVGSGIPLPVQDTPEVALAKAEHLALLRKAELTHLVPEVIETPIVTSDKVLEIPQLPIARTSYINVEPFVTSPLVRISAIPESPEVLEIESDQFAAHVARKNHLRLF